MPLPPRISRACDQQSTPRSPCSRIGPSEKLQRSDCLLRMRSRRPHIRLLLLTPTVLQAHSIQLTHHAENSHRRVTMRDDPHE
ncbi:hypothetical protein FA95DRAFT_1567360 [Auriscalpium vulgare]|uniref:Uncharacterized protein n=1 Tax=Auriscalpium vulgare TaxID=40419 RepID=A0ACB8R4Y0_9AGAM|nr:hypothetical protein FA95DRAFT_1567360 [Auriscalpium vulgare]